MVDARTLSTLIGSIYDCALDPSRWEPDARRFQGCAQLPNCGSASGRSSPSSHADRRTVGIEPYWLEQQAKHVAEVTPDWQQALASWPSFDEPQVISRHIPRAIAESSPYIQECLRPSGIVDILQYFLMHTPTRLAVFGVARHERQGIITEREIELGGLLAPAHPPRGDDQQRARRPHHRTRADGRSARRAAVRRGADRRARRHSARQRLGRAHAAQRRPIQGAGGVLQAKRPVSRSGAARRHHACGTTTRPTSARPGLPSVSPSPTCRRSLLTSCP